MVGVGTLDGARSGRDPRLQELARATARATGRLTASARMTPSFLIVGAQRCGTTSMYKTLSQHPMVLPAVLHKGVHYFDTGYGHGPAWYRGHFPLLAARRRAAPAPGRLPITGESSPYYMFHPLAGQRIARDLPACRLLVLLRDPVERAYSAHTHETARGFETEPFERALELEPVRLAGEEAKLIADPTYQSPLAPAPRLRDPRPVRRPAAPAGGAVRPGPDARGGQPAVLHRPRAGVRRGHRLPRHRCRPSGIVFEQHNARPRSPMPDSLRAKLEDQLADSDAELESWLGPPPSWRGPDETAEGPPGTSPGGPFRSLLRGRGEHQGELVALVPPRPSSRSARRPAPARRSRRRRSAAR